ncbi:6-hydroxy-d-nicotine oxidase [Trichoderma arundinaceum]|uniref:6-hydroxy-d-nicotine oxidase n=1 Tax=Trichoderma arundinaceum TaxID=490622 RepID=A0A395NPU9_TRIAR|nr:6-hydroxy-d-nicotine oxidase [Trichoderma arundinaceum]
MHSSTFFNSKVLVTLLATTQLSAAVPSRLEKRQNSQACRNLPGDAGWPSTQAWDKLNSTVGGRLLRGVPFGHVCYGPSPDAAACTQAKNTWEDLTPFLADPVNVISSYFENTTCSPFYGPLSTNSAYHSITCSQGPIAPYAIDVSNAAAAVAGVNFARENNIRLIIKNTGHDILGRSVGQGALSLWTHNLKSFEVVTYKSQSYTGPAARIGAGVQVLDLYEAAAAHGYRVVAGGCPTVGAAGGWVQSGGHGPLSSTYGLGADQTLEFEVVTADGRHLNASRSENSDLFWALSGGGPSNYAVVLSATMKVFPDGPVAGSTLNFAESNPAKFWAAVEAWEKHLLVLDTIVGLQTSVTLSSGFFSLDYATLPDATAADLTGALNPFLQELKALGITPTIDTKVHSNFVQHYDYFESAVYSRNVTVGNRIIPRDRVRNDTWLPELSSVFKEILDTPNSVVFIIAYNVTHARVGNAPGSNPVIQAWRDALFIVNFARLNDPEASYADLAADLALANKWQEDLRNITPGGGSYMNEATYNFPYWKQDYYAETYDKLAQIKAKYDPNYVLWSQPAAGSDGMVLRDDGHLCKA